MKTSTIPESKIQDVTSANPTMFDKWLWTGQVTDGSGLSFGAMAVAMRLAHHHNEKTGLCNPSLQTLADKLESSITAVKRYLTELRAAGFVDWKTGRNHKSSHYTLRQIRIHGPKGSDVPAYDVPPSKAPPAKRRKSPASSESNVVQFLAPRVVSDPASIVRSVVVSFPGSVSDTASCNSPISGSRYSPKSGSKYLKGNPAKGYPEGEVVEENETEASSASHASPLCLDGDGPSMARKEEKQPDKRPEAETRPADGKFTFDQIATPEWIEQQLASARETEVYYAGLGRVTAGPEFAEKLLRDIRAWAIRTEQRRDDFGWRAAWTSIYNQKRPSEAYKPAKGAPQI